MYTLNEKEFQKKMEHIFAEAGVTRFTIPPERYEKEALIIIGFKAIRKETKKSKKFTRRCYYQQKVVVDQMELDKLPSDQLRIEHMHKRIQEELLVMSDAVAQMILSVHDLCGQFFWDKAMGKEDVRRFLYQDFRPIKTSELMRESQMDLRPIQEFL